MKFKTLIASLLWLITVQISPAQVVGSVDFGAIVTAINDTSSPYYYPTLMERWEHLDTTLKLEEVRHLYYGWVFQPGYSGNSLNDDLGNLIYFSDRLEFSTALRFGPQTMTSDPVNLIQLLKMDECYQNLGRPDLAGKYRWQLFKLLDVINASGNGQSCESAWVVIREHDIHAWSTINNIRKATSPIMMGDCSRYSCIPNEDWAHGTAWFNLKIVRDFEASKKRNKWR